MLSWHLCFVGSICSTVTDNLAQNGPHSLGILLQDAMITFYVLSGANSRPF